MSNTVNVSKDQFPEGVIAWLLRKHPAAETHITNDVETRDRWVSDYGEAAVFPLMVAKEREKPFAWCYRLQGNVAWHFFEGETFDMAQPEAYERAALYLSAEEPLIKLEASLNALEKAAQVIIELDGRSRVHMSHLEPVSVEIQALQNALNTLQTTRKLLSA